MIDAQTETPPVLCGICFSARHKDFQFKLSGNLKGEKENCDRPRNGPDMIIMLKHKWTFLAFGLHMDWKRK